MVATRNRDTEDSVILIINGNMIIIMRVYGMIPIGRDAQ